MPSENKLVLLPCEDDVLLLRQVVREDEADLFEIYAHREVMAFASDPVFHDIADVRKTISSIQRNIESGEALELGIVLKSTGKLIGTCCLHNFGHKTAEIGYLLNRDYWRHGLMYRALSKFIQVYSAALHLSSVTAHVEPANSRSIRTLETSGFTLLRKDEREQIYCLTLASSDGVRFQKLPPTAHQAVFRYYPHARQPEYVPRHEDVQHARTLLPQKTRRRPAG